MQARFCTRINNMHIYTGMYPHWIVAFEVFIKKPFNTNGLKALCFFSQHGTCICVRRLGPFKGHSRKETYLLSSLWPECWKLSDKLLAYIVLDKLMEQSSNHYRFDCSNTANIRSFITVDMLDSES